MKFLLGVLSMMIIVNLSAQDVVISAFKKGDKYGFRDGDGNVIVKPVYDRAEVRNNIGYITMNGKEGLVNNRGEVIREAIFDFIGTFDNNKIALVKYKGRWGHMRSDGTYLSEPEYDEVSYFNDGYASLRNGDKIVYIDVDGKRYNTNPLATTATAKTNAASPVTEKKPVTQTTAKPATESSASIYSKGVEAERLKQYKTAHDHYQVAAEAGHAGAMYKLGSLYYAGNLENAKEEGYNTQSVLDAVLNGRKNKPVDYKKAAYWFTKAADAGNADAMYDLGRMYESGEGVTKDAVKGRQLIQKAADNGNKTAKYYLQLGQ